MVAAAIPGNGSDALILGHLSAFLILAFFTIGARSYTRLCIVHAFGLDDAIMIFCLLLYVISAVFLSLAVGKSNTSTIHSAVEIVSRTITATKWLFAWELSYMALTTIIKLSVGVTLLRINGAGKRYEYIICLALTIGVIAWAVTNFQQIFACSPVNYAWMQADPETEGFCDYSGLQPTVFVFSAVTICLDLLFAILPAFLLRKSRMSLSDKASVIFVLGLGSMASIANCVRLKYLVDLDRYLNLDLLPGIIVCSIVECGIGMFASSLATLRPLLKKLKLRGFNEDDDDNARRRDVDSFGQTWFTTVEVKNEFQRGGAEPHVECVAHCSCPRCIDAAAKRRDTMWTMAGTKPLARVC